jgi:hypothetical protein
MPARSMHCKARPRTLAELRGRSGGGKNTRWLCARSTNSADSSPRLQAASQGRDHRLGLIAKSAQGTNNARSRPTTSPSQERRRSPAMTTSAGTPRAALIQRFGPVEAFARRLYVRCPLSRAIRLT